MPMLVCAGFGRGNSGTLPGRPSPGGSVPPVSRPNSAGFVLLVGLMLHFHERIRAEPVQSARITQNLEHSAVHHRKASVMFTQASPA